MFTNARLKLTVWYLLILMSVCILFSTIIYRVMSHELMRSYERTRNELRSREEVFRMSLPVLVWEFLQDDYETAKGRILFWLLITNGCILIFSTLVSSMLAGKTLEPIKEALEEQKRFVADASHELHTPLTALKTSIEVALRDKKLSTQEARCLLQNNLNEVDELATLNEGLLSLARFEKNGSRLNLSRVDITDIVHLVLKRLTPLTKKKNISIDLQLVPAVIEADEISLTKLCTILLDNAIKYTPKKGTVSVKITKKRNQISITVKDTGPGISKKDSAHIFERFYRADSSRTKTSPSGFGLGLAIAVRIVKMHRGTIQVTSKIGEGASFTVTLPS